MQIMTTLPASEHSFLEGKPQRTLPLCEVFTCEGASTLSPFAFVCVSASLLGRNLPHFHRMHTNGDNFGLHEHYWKPNRSYDDFVTSLFEHLPGNLRLSSRMNDANVIFANLCIHASTIWYHQKAIIPGETCRVLAWYAMENNHQCLLAASRITSLTKLIRDLDLLKVFGALFPPTINGADEKKSNTFAPFPLFMAARVFVQQLKFQPNNPTIKSLLQYLVSILNIMKSRNPLARMFLSRLNLSNVPASGYNRAASS
jgi:hypothetical protein